MSRPIDIGYRARRLPFYLGRGGQEKHEIGLGFLRRAPTGLHLDINVEESGRLYGDDWWNFLARCKGVIGVEAGGSVFDLDDSIRPAVNAFVEEHPRATFEEVADACLDEVEDSIYYRTISPRHFEAAAFRCCQILFEGSYSGILEPAIHYLPLKKDFSNFDAVVKQFMDPEVRERLRDAAFEDLIASGRYHYESFVQEFDSDLQHAGVIPQAHRDPFRSSEIDRALTRWEKTRRLRARVWSTVRSGGFPARRKLVAIGRRLGVVPPAGKN